MRWMTWQVAINIYQALVAGVATPPRDPTDSRADLPQRRRRTVAARDGGSAELVGDGAPRS